MNLSITELPTTWDVLKHNQLDSPITHVIIVKFPVKRIHTRGVENERRESKMDR